MFILYLLILYLLFLKAFITAAIETPAVNAAAAVIAAIDFAVKRFVLDLDDEGLRRAVFDLGFLGVLKRTGCIRFATNKRG